MSSPFLVRQRLRFGQCDPAGIAYYPRYFEICDAAIEDWTEQVLGVSRRVLHLDMALALPTVDLHATFSAPSRLGDWLDIALSTNAVGRTSVTLQANVSCEGQQRFTVLYKQVLMGMADGRPVSWPPEWRDRLSNVQKEVTS